MTKHRVLLVGNNPLAVDRLTSALRREAPPGAAVDAVPIVHEAIARVSERGYDVVVCWAERPDELAGVIRIRKSNPDLPIVLLTGQSDPSFLALGLEMGATRVLGEGGEVGAVSKAIHLALETRDLAREAKANAIRARGLAGDVSSLARRSHALARESLTRISRVPRQTFLPLLVEDNPDDAFLLVQAFAQAEVFAPLPIMRSGEQAVAYLSGRCFYRDRNRYPLPTAVILDIGLPRRSGFDVLEWVRKQPEHRHLPIIMLSGSADKAWIDRAYHLGVNSYLVKPTSLGGLVELVRGLAIFWSGFNHPKGTL